jgi:hypothetical protein
MHQAWAHNRVGAGSRVGATAREGIKGTQNGFRLSVKGVQRNTRAPRSSVVGEGRGDEPGLKTLGNKCGAASRRRAPKRGGGAGCRRLGARVVGDHSKVVGVGNGEVATVKAQKGYREAGGKMPLYLFWVELGKQMARLGARRYRG